jgi:predicted nucleotidyltransferase component of viral defense system
MFEQALPKTTRAVLMALGQFPSLKKFYLTGGTALALSYGHRKSDDLDFFSLNRFKPSLLQAKLEQQFQFRLRAKEEGTLHCQLNKVNVSFLHYPYPVLGPFLDYHGIAISSPLDIALTKIAAIAQRGSRRDFIDLYWMCREELALSVALKKFREKYGATNYSPYHLIKSLVFFADAEKEPMPKLLRPVSWPAVKTFFETEVGKLNLHQL